MIDPWKEPELFLPKEPPPWGWMRIIHAETQTAHGIPTWDIHAHVFSEDCPCGTVDDDGTIIHTSWDGREAHEAGAKMH